MRRLIFISLIVLAPVLFDLLKNESTKGDMQTFILWLASAGVVSMLAEIATALNEITIAIMEKSNADQS